MTILKIFGHAGPFAENKDIARKLRLEIIEPALKKGENITLDFADVSGATQSFIHALISELFRNYGGEILDRLEFKNCNNTVRKVISIVSDYMQEAEG